MTPTEIARAAVDVAGVLLEIIRAIQAAVDGDKPQRVREILSSGLLTTLERRHAEARAALHFSSHDDGDA